MTSVTIAQKKLVYIYFEKPLNVDRTVPLGGDVFLDLNKEGKAIGIEILFHNPIPDEAIKALRAIE